MTTKIDIGKVIQNNLQVLQKLIDEAVADNSESFSSRIAPIKEMNAQIERLLKSEEKLHNMQELQQVENLLIKTIHKYLTPDQAEAFTKEINKLELESIILWHRQLASFSFME